jgi:two-component system, cell cycle sensor histidine kinase and response regulator CckA
MVKSSHSSATWARPVEPPRADLRVLAALRGWSAACAISVCVLSCAVLVGWTLRVDRLKSVFPGLATMKANTALGLALCGVGLLLSTRRVVTRSSRVLVRACASIVVVTALVTLGEYAGLEAGVDELLFQDVRSATTANPGRMSPLTAACFVAIGSALWVTAGRRGTARLSRFLSLSTAAAAGWALIGYLYSIRGLSGLASYSEMALHTAVAFELLAFGVLFVNAEGDTLALLASDSTGGVTARRLVPVVVLAPVIVGWCCLQGHRLGHYRTEVALAIIVIGVVIVLTAFVWQHARSLIRLDETRNAMEAALRGSEERYRRFFDEDLAGAFLTRPDGTIVDCNTAFVRIFGFQSAEQAIGTSAASLYASEDLRASILDRLRRDGKIEALDVELRRHDGGTVSVISNVVGIFDPDGRLREIKGYVLDNTARKRGEEQLRQGQRIDAVGRLAGGVAHDFNNLLGVISGYNQLLLRNLPEDHVGVRYATEVRKAAERATALTRQLLAFSRRQVMQPRVLDLNAIVMDMKQLLDRLIGEDVELVALTASAVEPVMADPTQIEQVIMNLAVNARDAMPQGGTLTLETGNAFLDAEYVRTHTGALPGRHAMLVVSDTGLGMDAATRSRIFEPFFTTKDEGEGTGLGLATVYGIVKQSGGSIWVYSEPAHGTTFKVYLPAAEGDVQVPRVQPVSDAAPGGSETILLVEDEEMLREIVREALEAGGYRVLAAPHGAEARRICESHRDAIDLLLTDAIMPGGGGRKLAERIRASRPEIKVLYMSGYTDDAIVRHGVLTAEVAFLQKPFTLDDLAYKVRSVLDSQGPSGGGV